YLGHYVAGNLAARHGVHVRLDNSPGNGVTATVDLPPGLLTGQDVAAAPEEHHAAREVWPPAPTEHRAPALATATPALPPPVPAPPGPGPALPAPRTPAAAPDGALPRRPAALDRGPQPLTGDRGAATERTQ